MKPLKHSGRTLVTQPKPLRLVEPGHRMLHHHAKYPKARAVRLPHRTRQLRLDLPRPRCVDVRLPTATTITRVFLGTPARSAPDSRHRRNGLQQGNRHFPVRHVRRRGQHLQYDTVAVDDHVPLAPVFRPVRRVGAGVRPPKTARNDALSAMARESSSRPCLPSRRNSTWCNRGQTPAFAHSFMRRQQVGPLGASSAGMSPQAEPVRSTKSIPTRQARSSAGGRPPFGRGGRTGNRGCTSRHNSSVTHSRAMSDSRKDGLYGLFPSTSSGPQGF